MITKSNNKKKKKNNEKNVQKCSRRAWRLTEHPPGHLQSRTERGLGGFDKYAGKFFVVTAIWGGCFTASAVPNRAALEWCQTARRAFAQTVTRLPLTTADGVSHACCAGRLCYFSAWLCLKPNLDHTHTSTHTRTNRHTEEREGRADSIKLYELERWQY